MDPRRIGVFGWGLVAPGARDIDAFREAMAHPHSWLTPFTGFGPIEFGMTVREAAGAMQMKLDEDHPSARCHYAANEEKLPGIALMVFDGQVGGGLVGTEDGHKIHRPALLPGH